MTKSLSRRALLKNSFFTSAGLLALPQMTRAASLCQPSKTPKQTAGPFYPIKDQADTDSDLTSVNGRPEVAQGKIVIIEGTLSNQNCTLVAGALVEIWQACHSGRYNHPSDPNTAALDPHFQYWGKAVTDVQGQYRFRTVIPGSYPADVGWDRPPHVHFKVSKLGYRELITQMYFSGEALNEQDLILKSLRPEDQEKVIVEFKEIANIPYPVGHFAIQIEKIERNIS